MSILDFFKQEEVLKKVEEQNKVIRLIIYFTCVFLVALFYNVFFVPNNLVMGGMGGLAIVVKQAFGLNTSIFLLLTTVILLFLSYIFLGKDVMKKNLGCAIFL